jgi:hypothetical protein
MGQSMATNCVSELRACNIHCQEHLGGPREQNCILECLREYGRCLVKRKADWWFLVRATVPPGRRIDPTKIDPVKIAEAVGKGFTDALTEELTRLQTREPMSKRPSAT